MSNPNKPYVIVVGVDRSETGDLALEQALVLGARQGNTEVHAVDVVTVLFPAVLAYQYVPTAEVRGVPLEEARTELERYLAEKFEAFRQKLDAQTQVDLPRLVGHLRIDAPSQEIAQLAADLEADLVVVGTHGRRGVSRMLLGSVAEAVVRLAPCPVLVVRPKKLVAAPAIQPPCPECVKTRQATAGARFWCDQHSERHGQRHTYHSTDRISADGGMPLVFRE